MLIMVSISDIQESWNRFIAICWHIVLKEVLISKCLFISDNNTCMVVKATSVV